LCRKHCLRIGNINIHNSRNQDNHSKFNRKSCSIFSKLGLPLPYNRDRADITSETLTAIDSRIDVKQSGFYNASGTWTKTDNVIYSNSSLNLGDTVRSNTTDYIVKKKDAYTDIGGTVEFYTYLA
jgi:hypothetical protein